MLPAGDEQRRRHMPPALPPPLSPPRKTRKLDNRVDIYHSMASALSDDLRKEILLRLPAKSLIRFKSVCKNWLSLISSDYFCRQHTLRRPKLQQSLILQHFGNRPHPEFFYWKPTSFGHPENATIPYSQSPDVHGHDCRILQSCNGLLLLVGSGRTGSVYCVYNPTTRQSKEIHPPYNGADDSVSAIALAFDPSESPHYRILCIMGYPDGGTRRRIEVYDSESRTWKLGLGQFTLPPRYEAQYWKNSVVWWRTGKTSLYRFDIAKKEMKTLSSPCSQKHDSYLQELDGRLYYVALDRYGHTQDGFVSVWELGRDDRWVQRCHRGSIEDDIGKLVRLVRCDAYSSATLIYHLRTKMEMRAYNFVHQVIQEFKSPQFDHPHYDVERYSNGGELYLLRAFLFGETLALV